MDELKKSTEESIMDFNFQSFSCLKENNEIPNSSQSLFEKKKQELLSKVEIDELNLKKIEIKENYVDFCLEKEENNDHFDLMEERDESAVLYDPHVVSEDPKCISTYELEYTKELETSNNFYKGVKWSPDGSSLLTNLDDNSLRVLNFESSAMETNQTKLIESSCCYEADVVYDYCWYPLMNYVDPNTCCFLSTSRDTPIHLWDSLNGELRATYRSYNHLDEIEPAKSLSFNNDGSKIYSGFNRSIRIFDTTQPGRICTWISTSRTKKSRVGQKGIISCFSFPMSSQYYAAGSYQGSVCLYDSITNNVMTTILLERRGVTHIKFMPNNDNYLMIGCRMNDKIYCYDVRSPRTPLCHLKRKVTTNQRIYFDISSSGKFLITGSQNSELIIYDLEGMVKTISDCLPEVNCVRKINTDCENSVNGVSFNSFYSLIAASTGERIFNSKIKKNNKIKIYTSF